MIIFHASYVLVDYEILYLSHVNTCAYAINVFNNYRNKFVPFANKKLTIL